MTSFWSEREAIGNGDSIDDPGVGRVLVALGDGRKNAASGGTKYGVSTQEFSLRCTLRGGQQQNTVEGPLPGGNSSVLDERYGDDCVRLLDLHHLTTKKLGGAL